MIWPECCYWSQHSVASQASHLLYNLYFLYFIRCVTNNRRYATAPILLVTHLNNNINNK